MNQMIIINVGSKPEKHILIINIAANFMLFPKKRNVLFPLLRFFLPVT